MTEAAVLKSDVRYSLMRAMWEEVPPTLLGVAWAVQNPDVRLRFVFSRYGLDEQVAYGGVVGELEDDLGPRVTCVSSVEQLDGPHTMDLQSGESWFFAMAGHGVSTGPDGHPSDEVHEDSVQIAAVMALHRGLVGLVTPGLRIACSSVHGSSAIVRLGYESDAAQDGAAGSELQRRMTAQLGPDVHVEVVVETDLAPPPLRPRSDETRAFQREEHAYD